MYQIEYIQMHCMTKNVLIHVHILLYLQGIYIYCPCN